MQRSVRPSIRLSVCPITHAPISERCIYGYGYYITQIRNPVLEVEPTGHSMAIYGHRKWRGPTGTYRFAAIGAMSC